MESSPVPPPPGPLPEGQSLATSDAVQKALEFARETGKSEIETIERLHKRTLLALLIPLGLFSFVGFINLSHLVTQTTIHVVHHRLEDQLTKRNIDAAVQAALQERATQQIKAAVDAQVTSAVQEEVARQGKNIQHLTKVYTGEAVSRLHPQIESIAREEADRLVRSANAPRILTSQQRIALTTTAKQLGPRSVEVDSLTDPEAEQYSEQISQALTAGGWQVGRGLDLAAGRGPRYGMVIGSSTPSKPDMAGVDLLKCLNAAGFHAEIVADPEGAQGSRLIVLSKSAN